MAFTRALYYPFIDITNEHWLKNAILYWDEINTIVPYSMEEPYIQPITSYLAEVGILKPYRVNPENNLIKILEDDVIKYINSNEGQQVLQMSFPTCESQRIHPEKMSYIIQDELHKFMGEDGWLHTDSGFANFYMTLLANRICESSGISPLTDNINTSKLNNYARLDSNENNLNAWNYQDISNRGQQLAQSLLLELSFNDITISDETSIDDILIFKRHYNDELCAFRQEVERLTKHIPIDASIEQIQQRVNDTYHNQFLPAYNNLKKSLKGLGIRTCINAVIKVSLASLGTTNILDLPTNFPLLVGAGISMISSLVSYNKDKEEILRNNPYSYLLALQNGIRANTI